MILLLHILIATSSVVLTAVAFFRPTQKKLRLSYWLISLTVLSGTLLIWQKPSHMLKICLEGLVYVTVLSLATVAVKYRLKKQLVYNAEILK